MGSDDSLCARCAISTHLWSDPHTGGPIRTPESLGATPLRRLTTTRSEGVREGHRTGLGWVEPRLIEARPTVKAEALGGPLAAVRRLTHPDLVG